MRFAFLLLVALCLPVASGAAERDRPILRMALDKQEVIPGQPVVLRVTVLVPSWMPKPPVFPALDMPNVITRLPERASGPVSERIGGTTWSGVTRAYRLYPMIVGRFAIPPQPVLITYADPQTRAPVEATLKTDAIAFAGVAPEGVGDLDPFIAADALTVEQTIDGDTQNMEPGDAVVRRLTARIEGTAPIFLPALLPVVEGEGLAVYPAEPEVTEREQRGTVSGTRVERVTYVAEAGGRHALPAVRLRWYNLESGQVETVDIPGFDIAVRGPPPVTKRSLAWRNMLPEIAGAVLLAMLAGVAFWRLGPFAGAWYRRWRDAWLESEAHAFAAVKAALAARELGAVLNTVDRWNAKLSPASAAQETLFESALERLGGELFGSRTEPPSGRLWSDAAAALRAVRRHRRAQARRTVYDGTLPSLNPCRVPR